MSKNAALRSGPSVVIPDLPPGLPTVFRGVFWDDGWEFDAPCIMYRPFCRFGIGGNSGHFDNMVEDVCIDISLSMDGIGKAPSRKWSPETLKEFLWRNWSVRGFARRRNAWHLENTVRWFFDEDGSLAWEVTSEREQWGPFAA